MHDQFKSNAICEMSSHIDDEASNKKDIVDSKKGKRIQSGVASPYNAKVFSMPNDHSLSSSADLRMSHQSSGIGKRSSRAAKLLKS